MTMDRGLSSPVPHSVTLTSGMGIGWGLAFGEVGRDVVYRSSSPMSDCWIGGGDVLTTLYRAFEGLVGGGGGGGRFLTHSGFFTYFDRGGGGGGALVGGGGHAGASVA